MVSLFLTAILVLVCLPAFADGLVEARGGDEVERFQQRLADLGYLSGAVDGIYGKQTTQAVFAFQALNGLPATGEPDENTQSALFSARAEQLPDGLSRGDESESVRLLQERLIFLGFLDDEADGNYGKTRKAPWRRIRNT